MNWKEKAIELAKAGNSWRQVAKLLEIPRSTVSDYLRKVVKPEEQKNQEGPKILLVDIETAPLLASVWRLWKENVGLNQIKEDWYILSYCAKWLGSDEVIYEDVRDLGLNDKPLMESLWKLLDQADWVIAHNGIKFDLPKIQARMILNGMKPFSPVKQIDTCQVAKKYFGFTSNKLAYLSEKLAPEHVKSEHKKFPGFDLWRECIAGSVEAWQEMAAYNISDVLSLEAVYLKLRPWIPNHPNFALHVESGVPVCVCCGSANLREHEKESVTMLSSFTQYVCNDCGKHVRSRKNTRTKEQMSAILTNSL